MAAREKPLYLVRLDEAPLESLGAVLAICNAVVIHDRDRVHHTVVLALQMIHPPDRLPCFVQKNLTRAAAYRMVGDLVDAGAKAAAVETE